MASVKEEPRQMVAPKRMLVQGQIDRDVYWQFRDLIRSHKLTVSEGLGWAMRSVLSQAGVKVRADRGDRQRAENGGGGTDAEALGL